jgi:hypothetical protein
MNGQYVRPGGDADWGEVARPEVVTVGGDAGEVAVGPCERPKCADREGELYRTRRPFGLTCDTLERRIGGLRPVATEGEELGGCLKGGDLPGNVYVKRLNRRVCRTQRSVDRVDPIFQPAHVSSPRLPGPPGCPEPSNPSWEG